MERLFQDARIACRYLGESKMLKTYYIPSVDMDWFAVDSYGNIAHFASGGYGMVPFFSKLEVDNVDPIFETFFLSEEFTETIIFESNLPSFTNDDQKKIYLSSYEKMSRKGFFSFDVGGDEVISSTYNLISLPKEPVNLKNFDLDKEQSLMLPHFENIIFEVNLETINLDTIVVKK